MAQLLKQHHARQAEEKLKAGGDYEDQGFVFATALGHPLDHNNVAKRSFKPLLKRAGLSERLTPYSLRHSAATALVKAKEGIKTVAEVLGHSSSSFTMDTYVHGDDDMLESAASIMGQAMFAPQNPTTSVLPFRRQA